MSINKKFLPELALLKAELLQIDSESFYNKYVLKADALIGPAESVDFINEFAREYEN